mmetsp:Transcript_69078/g.202240  ORF Transcript_69078/g.202240 Transcript_69078/m.202240 type:complete len:536 (+) Transcript_69078:373-1980(+)
MREQRHVSILVDIIAPRGLREAGLQQRAPDDRPVLLSPAARDPLCAPGTLDQLLQLCADGGCSLQGRLVQRMLPRKGPLVRVLLPLREDVQQGEVVSIVVEQAPRRRRHLSARAGGDEEGHLRRQHRDDAQHLRDALELRGNEQAEGVQGVDGQRRQLLADGRERVGPVERPDAAEEVGGLHQGLLWRLVHKWEARDLFDAQGLELQVHGGHLAAQDLRGRLRRHPAQLRLRVEPVGLARRLAARAPGPLARGGLGCFHQLQHLNTSLWMTDLELYKARVHHISDAGDGDGGLRDVRGEHDLAAAGGRGLEDQLLLVEGQRGVDGPDNQVVYSVRRRQRGRYRTIASIRRYGKRLLRLLSPPLRENLALLLQQPRQTVDVLLSRKEDQHVARWTHEVQLEHRHEGGLQVVRLRGGSVVELDGVLPPRHVHEVRALRTAEELDERMRVERCGHHHDFQGRAIVQCALDKPQQHVRVDAPLMGLVKHDNTAAAQAILACRLANEHAISHILHARLFGSLIGETHMIPDQAANTTVHL